ncbi:M56 family metallopeptidase [Lysobacter sp. 5GHs7-4]|uniref:M56 family metallopeptidase n=1 Tax=Lysobacter sp. 5GHs7-4 TaxID=2904253 RepID=UPI001E433B62|nr:M56 family metallopeptidase [Lysobacter sp. 5GHs7-4]UHQ23043.1 M56 family metallopeptidase [Lysobacter sp. 5GHs7-4]
MTESTRWLLDYAIEHLLISLVVASILFVALRLRAIAPEKRAGLLLAAFALAVVGPIVPTPTDAWPDSIRAAASMSATTGLSADTPPHQTPALAPAGAHRAAWTIAPELAALLIALWLGGAVWRLARLTAAHRAARRIVAVSQRAPAIERAHRDAIPAGVEVRLSPAFGPAAIGLVRPAIVLPASMLAALPAPSLRAVLLHEASHIRRGDLAVLLLQRTAEALFWWNPVLRRMGAALDMAREIACDVGASRAYGCGIDYADALLDSIERLPPAPRPDRAQRLCAAASLSTLEQRIDAIVSQPPASIRIAAAPALVAGALATAWLAAGMAAPRMELMRETAPSHPTAAASGAETALSQSAQEALAAAQDEYSRAVQLAQDRYTNTLQSIESAHTRGLEAIERDWQSGHYEQRIADVNRRYDQATSKAESDYLAVTKAAESRYLATQASLGYP